MKLGSGYRSRFSHDDEAGGELHFVMQAAANTDWATRREDRPFTTTPYGK